MIFQYPRKSEGVTEKASETRLMDSGTSEAVDIQANPYVNTERDVERKGDQVAKFMMPALKKSFWR